MSLDLGELSARITVDDKGFGQGLDRGHRQFGIFAKKIAVAATAAGIAAGGALVVGATKQFAALQTGMNEVFTLLPGISESAMGKMTDQVKGFATEFGVLPDKVVPALYQALSAGVPPDNVFAYLETAQMAAKGGVTDLTTAVDGISSVVNAYGDDVVSAAQASDLMFTAVKLGKTNFEELSGSLYNVIPTASALGVQFGDVTAAIAAMTAQGTPTSVATTQMRQLLVELSKEGSKTSKTFQAVAGEGFKDFIAGGGNVQDALKLMEADAKSNGKGINDLFSSVEAGSAALALTGKGAAAFSKDLEGMDQSAGATKAAYEQMDQGLAASWNRIKAAASVALIDVGEKLAPLVQGLADFALVALPVVVDGIGDVADGLGTLGGVLGTVAGFVDDNQTTFLIIAGIITAVLLPAIIAWGVQATIAGAKSAAAWVMSQVGAAQSAALHVVSLTLIAAGWVKAGVQATASALKVAAAWLISMGPVGLVIAAIAGVVFLIIKYWDEIKGVFSTAVSFVLTHWKKFAAGLLIALTGPLGLVVVLFIKNFSKIKGAVSDIVGFVKSIPGKLAALAGRFGSAGRSLINAFVNGMKNAGGVIAGIAGNVWNAVRRLLNGAISRINAALEFTIRIPGPDIHINPPNIPQLAEGGLIKASRGGTLAILAEAGEDEWAVPESKADAFARARLGGGKAKQDMPAVNQYIYPAPGMSEKQVGDASANRLMFQWSLA